MGENVRLYGLGGPPSEIFSKNNEDKQLKENVSQKIKEENIKAEIEKEKEKEMKDKVKQSIMSEDDLKLLLLVFGSRGNTTLLEKVVRLFKKSCKVS